MATLTIRDLDDALKRSLRMRAASRNRSMEEEARQILRAALAEAPVPSIDLATRIRARFAGLGDVALRVPERESVRTPPSFSAGAGSESATTAAKRPRPKPRA
ncbi:MAG: plasmid stabilization protein [Rubrivivax sp.]|nr:plasmid stabilization protein [Rubrivivax sp.]